MKGSNELKLNQATMIEAMQYWLDSQLVHKVVVESVSGQTINGRCMEYTIGFSEKEPKP